MSSDEVSEDITQENHSNSRTEKEISTWRPFVEALRFEDRQTLRDLLNSVSSSYAEAITKAERGYDTESLLMSIILDQQKTISWLSTRIRKLQEKLESQQS